MGNASFSMLLHHKLSDKLKAFSTTRHGGCGTGNYSTMNINRFCGDNIDVINKNLNILCAEIGIDSDKIIMPHQTHGTEILQISNNFLSLTQQQRNDCLEGIDALVTDIQGVCIGVSTADCIPLIVYDPINHAVATIHAGWRGTVARITTKTIKEMQRIFGSKPQDLTAVIGPGISLEAFEVGDEVYQTFASEGFNMSRISCKQRNSKTQELKWHINLPLCNKIQLLETGVEDANIHDTAICTYNNSSDYFSARKLGTLSGRIFTAAILT